MNRGLLTAVPVVALAVLIAACGPSGEAIEQSAPNPVLVQSGADLYAENCAVCHGDDLRGTAQGPSFLSEVYEPGHHADGAFLLAVQQGAQPHHWDFGPMPPIPGLSPEDVEAIVAFVRDRQQVEGFDPYP